MPTDTCSLLHEGGHRQQMLRLAQSGQRSAALAQYELCQQALATEYGVAPMAETTALYTQIKAGKPMPMPPEKGKAKLFAYKPLHG